jgi:hypothetical protein
MAINYEELFGDDFLPILEAIDKGLPNNVENMVLGQLDKMVFATESFTNRFEKTYQNLVAQGVGPEQIKKLMADDMSKGGKLFGTLRNEIKEDVVNTMNQASRLGQFEEYGTSDIFTWVTVGGHKICGDCDSRAGEMKSYNDWAREGLPGSGWSVCGGYCYCVLDPVGRIDSKLEVARKAKLKAEKGATVAPQATQVLRYATSRSHAKAIVRQANAVEPDITGSIVSNVEGVGGKMTGLKYRMKGQESLARKLIDYNKLEGAPIPSILSESINDVIRYTGVFDDAGYVNGINQTIATLESQGYKILKVKNKWGDDGYKGVHYILESDTKHRLELQFHTKKSIHVKEKFSHPLYEEMRAAGTTSARKKEIKAILAKKWGEVDRPPGWETIGKPKAIKQEINWKGKFNSANEKANQAFIDTFDNSNNKFKKFASELPEIKHISDGPASSSFFYDGRWKQIEKYGDKDYLFKHGGIHMQELTGPRAANVVRHEYGHFIHHNMHYKNVPRWLVRDFVHEYRRKKPKDKLLFVEDFFYGRPQYLDNKDSLVSLLKFEDAFLKSQKRFGVPSRSKTAKEALKKKQIYYTEMRTRVFNNNKIQEGPMYDWATGHTINIKKVIPDNDKLIKTMLKEGPEGQDTMGIIQDLVGAITKNKVGYGHANSYYKKFSGKQHHETFANLTCLYTHKNPIYWDFVKKELPELANYFEEMLEEGFISFKN